MSDRRALRTLAILLALAFALLLAAQYVQC
jgi:hypothetical protein